jgi:uncharacterized protein YdeI (YjbR/CyaY-like superfamily)
MKQLYFKTAAEWREWLKKNYDKETELWLEFFNKESGAPTIDYESAVEEALCFGWIDSIVKNLDDKKYVRKFTPRHDISKWSELNKNRAERLIKNKRMTKIGLKKIETAKLNGCWYKSDRPDINLDIPDELQSALDKNEKAKTNFNQLTPTYQMQYIGWITMAKQLNTKEKRISESITRLEKGEKLGLK